MEDKLLNRFRYALCNGRIVSIDDVTKESRKSSKYMCLGCGQEMVAALGEKNVHHFRHKNNENCSHETYLHNYAKKRIKELFDNQEHFLIQYKAENLCSYIRTCKLRLCKSSFIREIDLKKFFDTCEVEKKCGDFRPDLLLSHSSFPNRKLFIEIHVHNPCTQEKIKSGYRIIEIDVVDDSSHIYPFDERFTNLHFYNFSFNRNIVPSTKLERFTCIQKAEKKNVHSLALINCTELTNHLENARFDITVTNPQKGFSTTMLGYAHCVIRGIQVRNCRFCIRANSCQRIIHTQKIKDNKTNKEKAIQRKVSPNMIDFELLWDTAKQCQYFFSNIQGCNNYIKKFGSHNFILWERNQTKK